VAYKNFFLPTKGGRFTKLICWEQGLNPGPAAPIPTFQPTELHSPHTFTVLLYINILFNFNFLGIFGLYLSPLKWALGVLDSKITAYEVREGKLIKIP
jgi:hypothetical protein